MFDRHVNAHRLLPLVDASGQRRTATDQRKT
jgi:hypothetical protein